MSSNGAQVSDPQGGVPAPAPRAEEWVTRSEVRAAGVIAVALAVAGVLLGLVWAAISPRTNGFVYMPDAVVAAEKESLVASDGRFVLLTCAVGLVAAVAVWLWRSVRGPAVALALGAGGVIGALLTDVVGGVVGGGRDNGPLNAVIKLPIEVRAHGLLLAEAVLALLVYAGCALFTKRDDLNRPAPAATGQAAAAAPPWPPPPQPMQSAP